MATHFSATIKLKGHHSNWGGPITNENLLVLANNGTTPHGKKVEELQPTANAIRAALERGEAYETKTAYIVPETRS